MKTLLLAFFISISGLVLNAQVLEGTIIDGGTKKPLPYVNIGVVGKNIGTVSNSSGKFTINIPAANAKDMVKVSMVGYAPVTLRADEFAREMADKEMILQPAVFELPPVVVSNKPLKEKVLGNTTESQSTTMGFDSNKLGYELGMLIKIKKSPTFLKSFTASVVSKENRPVKLRLNFYDVQNGLPGQLIYNKNIIVQPPVQNGKMTVDLQPYHIVVEDDFFVTLEWIETTSGRIMFSSSILKGGLVAREVSQGDWEKVGMFGVGFTVLAQY